MRCEETMGAGQGEVKGGEAKVGDLREGAARWKGPSR